MFKIDASGWLSLSSREKTTIPVMVARAEDGNVRLTMGGSVADMTSEQARILGNALLEARRPDEREYLRNEIERNQPETGLTQHYRARLAELEATE